MKSKTRRFIGWAIIAAGALILIDTVIGGFEFWDFIWKLWPFALVTLGIYIIKNQRRFEGGSRSCGFSAENRLLGDLDISLGGKKIADHHFSTLFGDIRIDLTEGDFNSGEKKISASSLVGNVRIKIPDRLAVKLSSQSLIGDIKFDNLRRDGLFQKLEHIDNDFGSSENRLLLSVNSLIGDTDVNRIKIDVIN